MQAYVLGAVGAPAAIGVRATVELYGYYGLSDSSIKIIGGDHSLSNYIGVFGFGYGKGIDYMMGKSGLDTFGMSMFNNIKTDVAGCVTGGSAAVCYNSW